MQFERGGDVSYWIERNIAKRGGEGRPDLRSPEASQYEMPPGAVSARPQLVRPGPAISKGTGIDHRASPSDATERRRGEVQQELRVSGLGSG